MGQNSCPKTSVHNYQSTPHNIVEERDLRCSPIQSKVFGSVLHSLRVNSGRIIQIRPRLLPFAAVEPVILISLLNKQ